jgi:hypothetical protein
VKDETVLTEIAETDEDGWVRRAVLGMLRDHRLVGGNAKTDQEALEEGGESKARKSTRPAVCSTCRKPLQRDHSLDSGYGLSEIERALRSYSGGLYLGTVCQQCGKVECYSCRGGVGLSCSNCGGDVSPAYSRLFDA